MIRVIDLCNFLLALCGRTDRWHEVPVRVTVRVQTRTP